MIGCINFFYLMALQFPWPKESESEYQVLAWKSRHGPDKLNYEKVFQQGTLVTTARTVLQAFSLKGCSCNNESHRENKNREHAVNYSGCCADHLAFLKRFFSSPIQQLDRAIAFSFWKSRTGGGEGEVGPAAAPQQCCPCHGRAGHPGRTGVSALSFLPAHTRLRSACSCPCGQQPRLLRCRRRRWASQVSCSPCPSSPSGINTSAQSCAAKAVPTWMLCI